ncbi:hypothetical protein WMF26_13285 [Sorangium sp. So ce185]|uniref:hypothetical protein n=1 Tax=Sorangium sp. So ce185 TaxID=3133287 RepID=UPI003F5D65F2
MEDDLGTVLSREYAIERNNVEVHGASEGGVEALHEGDRTGLAAGRATRSRLLLLPARDLLDEDAARRGQCIGPQGALRRLRRIHPLARHLHGLIAAQAAIAVENALLIERSRQRSERIEAELIERRRAEEAR